MAVVGTVFAGPIVRLLGSNDAIFQYCYDYMFYLSLFVPFAILQVMFQFFFTTAGRPGLGLAATLLGGVANIVEQYATKRYRSNVMNWGMVPFQMEAEPNFEVGDYVFVPGIRAALDGDLKNIAAYVVRADGAVEQIELYIADMTAEERAIVKAGCLINYNKFKAAAE